MGLTKKMGEMGGGVIFENASFFKSTQTNDKVARIPAARTYGRSAKE